MAYPMRAATNPKLTINIMRLVQTFDWIFDIPQHADFLDVVGRPSTVGMGMLVMVVVLVMVDVVVAVVLATCLTSNVLHV